MQNTSEQQSLTCEDHDDSTDGKPPSKLYQRLMAMPFDILCIILSHLHPGDLYSLSLTSREFQSFLHSRKSAAIWQIARRRLTVYAPRKFLNHLDIDRAVSGHTIRSILMHKFTYRNEDVDSDDEDSDNVVASVEPNDEIRDEDNYQRHIPLEVPEAPPGLAEFSLARYLYVSKCQICGLKSDSLFNVAVLMMKVCIMCEEDFFTTFDERSRAYEATLTLDTLWLLPKYTEFLLSRPHWHWQEDTDDEIFVDPVKMIPCHDRVIAVTNIEADYEEFVDRKQKLSQEDFVIWYRDLMQSNQMKRIAGYKVDEYIWLYQTYCSYSRRVGAVIAVRDGKLMLDGIAKVLAHDGVHSEDKIKAAMGPIILEEFSEYARPWKEDAVATWECIRLRASKLLERYSSWENSHPFKHSGSARSIMLETVSEAWSKGRRNAFFHWLPLGIVVDLPSVQPLLQKFLISRRDLDQQNVFQMALLDIQSKVFQEVENALIAVQRRMVKLHIATSGTSINPHRVDMMHETELEEYLSQAHVNFSCSHCNLGCIAPQYLLSHACCTTGHGHTSFISMYRGDPPSMGEVLGGWRDGHIKADLWSPHLLLSLAKAANSYFTKRNVAQFATFPQLHYQCSKQNWNFRCLWPTCSDPSSSTGQCTPFDLKSTCIRTALYHLSDHITRDGASLEDLIDNYCMAVRGGPLGADDEYRIWDEDDGTLYLGKIPVSDWPAYSE